MIVTLYTRAGCHLCEAAEAVIADVVAGRDDVEVVTVDIDADRSLTDRYTVRVPVVAVDGVEIAEYEVRREDLAAALGDSGPDDSRRHPGSSASWLRRLLWGLGAILLLAGLVLASVALAAPDVFDDPCDRTQLVPPEHCVETPATNAG